jgi:hypothetical protein
VCLYSILVRTHVLLAEAPFSFAASQIGLVSLLGVVGVIGAQFTGRVYDRG